MRYLSLILCVMLIPQTAHSLYAGMKKQTQADYSPTRLIVKLKPEAEQKVRLGKRQGVVTTDLARLDSLNAKFEVKKQERLFEEFKETALKLKEFFSVYILEVPTGTDLKRMKAEYESRPEVEYAELDYTMELFEEPDDPLFVHQWYLNNTGQGYLGVNRVPGDFNDTQVIKYGTEDADVDALEAFERNDETTISLVGIIDTGVDLDHEDLADHIWTNPGEIADNGIDDDHNGFIDDFYGWDFAGDTEDSVFADNDPTDYFGHGTHCAGIVASVRGNATGVSGMNTPCRIAAIKIFPLALFSVSAKGIIYAADIGCDVINMSFGSPFCSSLIEDALDYAVSRGVLPIAASGNSGGQDDFYPASLPQAFAVGASNSDDYVTDFSTYGDHIEVVAPGEDILSLRADNTDMYATGGASGQEPLVHIVDEAYYLSDGTSMAAPCVTGVAAYILAASPGTNSYKVKEIIRESADDIMSPGEDIYSGHGRANLNSALQFLSGSMAKIDYPYENAIVSGDVAITGTAAGDSFQNYVLEYGEGYSPEVWTQIVSSDVPITGDTLGIWNSAALTGFYSIRLIVGDQNRAVVHVVADNDVYVKITSPSDGDTVGTYSQVYGYTVVPDFSHYILEYGYGESPSNWIPITTSTRMIAGDLLGDWLISFFQEITYSLLLTVETNAGGVYSDTIVVIGQTLASLAWAQALSNFGSLSPAVGDIDGDGYDEVVVGVGGKEYSDYAGGIEVFSHEGDREPGWPRDTDRNMMSSPALGDLDEDGIDDIVICWKWSYAWGGVHAYLSSSHDWSRNALAGGNTNWSLATPVIADLENDGHLEVLTASRYGLVYAWRNDGESVIFGNEGVFAHTVRCEAGMGFPCLVVVDLDTDGENEVVAGAARSHDYPDSAGGIYIWDADGNALLEPGDYDSEFTKVFGIAVADIDESDDLEIITLGSNGESLSLSAFKKDGTQPPGYPILLEGLADDTWFGNHPAVGDLEGDGVLEIVVTVWTLGEARVYGWRQDGTPLGSPGSREFLVSVKSPYGDRNKQILSMLGDNMAEALTKIRMMTEEELADLNPTYEHDPVFASVPETFGSPILADVDRDCNLDIIARAGYLLGNGYERVFAWDLVGNLIPGWPLFVSNVMSDATFDPYTPVFADIDKDGSLNMILVTGWPDFSLACWEFDIYHDSTKAHWPKYMHDKHNSGVFSIDDYPGWTMSDVVELINYLYCGGPAPNPLEGVDVNRDGIIDIGDVLYLINYLFRSGPPPSY